MKKGVKALAVSLCIAATFMSATVPAMAVSPADGALNGCPVIAVLFGNRFIDFFLDGLQPVLLFPDKPQAVGNDGVRTHTADDAQWPERLSNTQRERGRIGDGHF